MPLGDTSPLAEDTLRQRLVGARWILSTVLLGLAGCIWAGVMDVGPALFMAVLVFAAAMIPARRRPVAAAL
ncbi:MAG TPA: histidine kinase, partial [Ancylobacter sp.]